VRAQWNWGTGVALVYGAFALATVAFVIYAIANPAALVTDEYYLEAMRHDRRIEAAANARAAGVTVKLEREAGRRVAVLQLAPESLVTGVGTVTWYRPSDAALDRSVPLALDGAGTQRIDITGLSSGLWRMKVEWQVAGRPFYFEQAIMVTP
jgi:hypothetical protein